VLRHAGPRGPKFLRPLDKLPFERESGHESVHFEYVVLIRFSVGEEKDL
jgi:hypothetical protein